MKRIFLILLVSFLRATHAYGAGRTANISNAPRESPGIVTGGCAHPELCDPFVMCCDADGTFRGCCGGMRCYDSDGSVTGAATPAAAVRFAALKRETVVARRTATQCAAHQDRSVGAR
jgi:hypothetical protein